MFNNTETNLLFMESLLSGDVSKAIENQEKRGQSALVNSFSLPIKYGRGNVKDTVEYLNKLKEIGIKVLGDKDDLFMEVELPTGWSLKRTDHSMWSNLVDNKGRERASIFYKAAFYDRDAFINFNRRLHISSEKHDYDEEQFERQPEFITVGYEEVLEKVKEESSYDRDDRYYYGYEDSYEMFSVKKVKKPIQEKNPNYKPLTGYEKYSQPFHFEVYDYDGKVLFKSDIVKTDFEYSKDEHWKFYDHRDQVEEWAKFQCEIWLNMNYPCWKDDLSYWN